MKEEVLRALSYGLYAVGVKEGEKKSACIVNTVFQVTADPMFVAMSMSHDNYSWQCIRESGVFTVSVLSEQTPAKVIGALGFHSGREKDKLADIAYFVTDQGLPVVSSEICCWFSCRVVESAETPTHTIFIAEITGGSDAYSGQPMTYAYYHRVIRGRAPKNAPTYQPFPSSSPAPGGFVCPQCGYVYTGDASAFAALPPEWRCPVCGAPKSVFQARQ